MNWCRTCCYPDTKPDLYFNASGQCSACIAHAKRPHIDWTAREAELIKLLETTPRNGSGFDCIVPSSGGKDSTWQVLKMIELGARPLVVTASTCHLTAIGRANIDNLARYATTIEVTANREVRAKLNRLALEMVGDISWPEHCTIFTTPFKMAVDMGIPLIFYGENPQEAYGGPQGSDEARQMTRRWVSEFGGFLGLRPADFIGLEGIGARDMADYLPPPADDVARIGVQAHFLGQYYQWDSRRNADFARTHGMQFKRPCQANWWEDENLDNAVHGLHDFFGYLKYGYGRGAAQLSVDVRAGDIDRTAAMNWVRLLDGMFPTEYMDVPLEDVMGRIGMTFSSLSACAERFVNRDIISNATGRLCDYQLKDMPC